MWKQWAQNTWKLHLRPYTKKGELCMLLARNMAAGTSAKVERLN
jgi:hypothetical protein